MLFRLSVERFSIKLSSENNEGDGEIRTRFFLIKSQALYPRVSYIAKRELVAEAGFEPAVFDL